MGIILKFLKKDYKDFFDHINSYKILVGILVITVIVFSPVFMGSEFLTYDDNWYIYENKNVINFSWDSVVPMFSTPLAGQYSPLGEVYNSLLYNLFGKNATAFRLCAVMVHLLNILLLFNVLKSIFKDKLLVSFVTLVFAIHPLQVETVSWLSVMYRNAVFFMFLGYFFYLKYLNNDLKKYRLIPVFICYILACLFKEQAILFPVGIFLINMNKFDFKLNKRIVIETIFWGIIALVFGLLTIEIMHVGGPSLAGSSVSMIKRIDVLSKAILGYNYNFVFPFNLSFSYPYPLSKSNNFFIILAALILVGFGTFFSFKSKIIRFGFLWLVGFLSLSLALSFFSIRDTYMADRYAYIAVIGFSVLLYSILLYIQKKYASHHSTLSILLGCFSILFAIISFNRVSVFKNNKSVWANALKVNPQNQYANNSLGFYYRNNNEFEKAMSHYKRAIEIDSNYFLAHNNLGYVYSKKKEYESAISHFTKAISVNPRYKNAYVNRAAVAKEINKDELLLMDLRKLIEFESSNVGYREEIVKVLFKKKDYTKTIKEAINLLKFDVANKLAISHMAKSYFYLQKYKEAIPFITNVINNEKKSQGYYFFIRSVSYYQIGNLKNALKDIQSAQQLGYKVDDNYLDLIIREVKKSNNS